MATVSGTFSGTGQSSEIVGRKISIKMDVTGTASVDVEEKMHDGDWIKIATAVTADYRQVFDSPSVSALRLNNTSGSGPVDYTMATGEGG